MHYNNSRAIAKQIDFGKMQKISEYVAPNLIASFCIALKHNTDMSNDDIHYICSMVEEIWLQSEYEGRDIKQECYDEVDIDVRRWSEEGNIGYHDKYKKKCMAQWAEMKRSER